MANFTTNVWDNERIYLVDFSRARTGDARSSFPDVDDLGHHDDANAAEHGQICCAMENSPAIRVRFHRSEISSTAPLFLVSTNPAMVTITDPPGGKLTAERSPIIKFSTGAGNGQAVIEVRYKWVDGPVIGRLYVKVNQLIQIRLTFHLITLAGAAPNPSVHGTNFLGKSCPTLASKHQAMTDLFTSLNHTWIPYGLFFVLDGGIFDDTWGAAQMGVATLNPTDAQLGQGGALSANRSATHVNVYFVRYFQSNASAFGMSVLLSKKFGWIHPVGAPAASQHSGSGVYVRTDRKVDTQSLAHEFGHYVNLCMLQDPGQCAYHSMADGLTPGFDQKIRDDQGTRRRLMYPYTSLIQSNTRAWRNDTGYGNLKSGSFVNVRSLTQDVTTGEWARARNTATTQLYAP